MFRCKLDRANKPNHLHFSRCQQTPLAGADILLAEATFDTLNLKAAIFAIIKRYFHDHQIKLPVMLSDH